MLGILRLAALQPQTLRVLSLWPADSRTCTGLPLHCTGVPQTQYMPPRCVSQSEDLASAFHLKSAKPTHPHLSLSGLAYPNEVGVRQGYAVYFVVAGSSHRCSNATLIWLPDSPSLCSISPFLHDEALSLGLLLTFKVEESIAARCRRIADQAPPMEPSSRLVVRQMRVRVSIKNHSLYS
ncbi:hypothetical protein Landi51_11962 [Colletotrichum acutatum]